jgi:hypothetical protein
MTIDAPNLFCIGAWGIAAALAIIQIVVLVKDGLERIRK